MSKKSRSEEYGIPEKDWEATPLSVSLLLGKLWEENKELRKKVAELETRLEGLEELVNKNSQNSSKPPSKDKAWEKGKGEQKREQSKRKPGGQKGHKGHQRYLYAPEECKEIKNVKPLQCSHCGEELKGEDENPYRHQVVEIPPLKPEIREYRLHRLTCSKCGSGNRGKLPEGVSQKGYGERLTALVGVLSIHHHQSHRLVQELLREILGVSISVGAINSLRRELSGALEGTVEEAKYYIEQQKVLNSDETGFQQQNGDGQNPEGKKGWLWTLVTPLMSVFEVTLSRSQNTAKALIGENFEGIVTSDRYSAYNWLCPDQRQICWAHLKRDFTAISQRAGVSFKIGNGLLRRLTRLFRWWHKVRDGTMSYELFAVAVSLLRQGFLQELTQAADLPIGSREKTPLAKTVRTCRQLLKVEPGLWTFVEHYPLVEPTNNAAERALRPAVIARQLSFGSKSRQGSEFVARLLTVITSLRAQNRSVIDFLAQICQASRFGLQPPSLLPTTP